MNKTDELLMSDVKVAPRPERVTAVIPAYNEQNRIGAVLKVLQRVHRLRQIIVVDDGSTDGTVRVVKAHCRQDPRLELVRLPVNRGKAGALLVGARASRNDVILFLDADLIGLAPDHVEALIKPIQEGRNGMALGIFSQGRRQTDLSHRLTPFLSGQRCLRWTIFKSTPDLYTARWGVEAALSFHAWRNRYPVVKVPWRGVTHTMRLEKMNLLKSYWSHVVMWLDIGAYFFLHFMAKRENRVKARLKRLRGAIKSSIG